VFRGSLGLCEICGARSNTVSSTIGACSRCLRSSNVAALERARKAHSNYRLSLGLPEKPPRTGNTTCRICVNECLIPEGSLGFCGFWTNKGGRLAPITSDPRVGIVMWYYDPHPTNCVAGPVCPANTSRGYPTYTRSRGIEVGFYNLAVFYFACNLNCLFCQNWEHKTVITNDKLRGRYFRTVNELVEEAMDERITCICYFGGDPGPQTLHAITASRKIMMEKNAGSIKRICWETNGLENPSIMRQMAEVSIASGGIVKIDWKAWSPEIYEALTGVDGRKAVERIKENIKLLVDLAERRPEVPLLVVSTLLVPGYVDEYEVGEIARFLASLSNNIPYILLAFHPDNILRDLPPTSKSHALNARSEAIRAGLREIYLGNVWLLGDYY